MYRTVILIAALFAATTAFAQHKGFSPVANMATFKSSFTQAAQKTQSIKSDFVQEKNLAMLSDKIVSKGKFWFKKNNMVRMEYTTPFQYLMILNADKVYIKDGQKENKMSTRSNKLFQQINKIMVDCIQGTALDNKDFSVKLFESSGSYLIEMTPVTKSLKEYFKNINIIVAKKDYSVNTIDMVEPGGDNTVINFVNKELNASIPDATFAIK